MKKVLLLGGNGFVGRNIKEYFHNREDIRISAPSSRELNLLEEETVREFLSDEKFDVVINAAIGNPKRGSFTAEKSELEQDLRMFYNLEQCSNLYKKMLYFGSGAEFNKAKDICSVKEGDFFNGPPQNQYGLVKYTIGRMIENSHNIYNFRIFGLFGKYENWKTTFISGACCKALKGLPITIRQNVYFDYLYVKDFLPVIDWFVFHDQKYHTYNVSSGRKIDLITIAEMVREISGNAVPIYVCNDGLAKEYTASNQRLAEEYDLVLTDFRDSIRQLYQYYESIFDRIDLQSLLY